ncbi:MAG: hypothetical protein J4473_03430 [Candidatus Aenigmarchaeota archaeon]|nr:hypothetical protein [Candidatus Aenigmarchaeota archaeon]
MARKDPDIQVHSDRKKYDTIKDIEMRRGRAGNVEFRYYHVPKIEEAFRSQEATCVDDRETETDILARRLIEIDDPDTKDVLYLFPWMLYSGAYGGLTLDQYCTLDYKLRLLPVQVFHETGERIEKKDRIRVYSSLNRFVTGERPLLNVLQFNTEKIYVPTRNWLR